MVGLSQLKTHNALSIILLAPVEQSRKNPVSICKEKNREESSSGHYLNINGMWYANYMHNMHRYVHDACIVQITAYAGNLSACNCIIM